mmetsp:Transcript_5022/g.7259  ORF Transcript_5022/g.7259 Transcript_5022/m.7259 type:complete len:144 (-) Transcript_5022:279-710(-)
MTNMGLAGKAVKKNHVSFNSQVKITSSPRSSKKSWYRHNDYISFYKEGISTIKTFQVEHGNLMRLDPSKHCLRGLEKMISKSHQQHRRKYQSITVQMVLDAHAMQRRDGRSDPEEIKALSMIFSKISRDRALDMAAIDAKACK